MYIVVCKDVDPNTSDRANASAEFVLRVLCENWGYKLWTGEHSWMCKVPDKLGNMELRKRFFEEYPEYIQNYDLIPDEKKAVAYYKDTLKGTKESMGYGFITETLDNNFIKYDFHNTKSL